MRQFTKFKANLEYDDKFIYSYGTAVAEINSFLNQFTRMEWDVEGKTASPTTTKHINYAASELNLKEFYPFELACEHWILKPQSMQVSVQINDGYGGTKNSTDYKDISRSFYVVGQRQHLRDYFRYMMKNHAWQLRDSFDEPLTKSMEKIYNDGEYSKNSDGSNCAIITSNEL